MRASTWVGVWWRSDAAGALVHAACASVPAACGMTYTSDSLPTPTPPRPAPSTEQQAQLQLARKQIIFLHIGKTGGRTVEAFIEAAAGTHGLKVCVFKGSELDPRSFEMVGKAPDFNLTGKLDHMEKGCDVLSGEWGMEAVIHPWVAPKVHASLTILRDPALRAISQINHLMQHGNHKTNHKTNHISGGITLEQYAANVFSQTCVHDAALCASLTTPNKCRIGGSCGLFRNHMTSMLAAPHSRSLLQLVSLARNDSLLLETALVHLEGLSVVGITEQVSQGVTAYQRGSQTNSGQSQSPSGGAERQRGSSAAAT